MSFTIAITAPSLEKMPGVLQRFREGIMARFSQMQDDIGQKVVSRAVDGYLSGPRPGKLGRVTGALAGSIKYRKTTRGVEIGTNLPYAPVHEYGAIIRAKNVPFLRFMTRDKKWHSVKEVRIPKRPFLGPALNDSKESIFNIVMKHAEAALRDANNG